jgi:hypothetical protein
METGKEEGGWGERGNGKGQGRPGGDNQRRKQRRKNGKTGVEKGGGKGGARHSGLCANRVLGPDDEIWKQARRQWGDRPCILMNHTVSNPLVVFICTIAIILRLYAINE